MNMTGFTSRSSLLMSAATCVVAFLVAGVIAMVGIAGESSNWIYPAIILFVASIGLGSAVSILIGLLATRPVPPIVNEPAQLDNP